MVHQPGREAGVEPDSDGEQQRGDPDHAAKVSPWTHCFSNTITIAIPSITGMFITPTATSDTISIQQHPMHTSPWCSPARRCRDRPWYAE